MSFANPYGCPDEWSRQKVCFECHNDHQRNASHVQGLTSRHRFECRAVDNNALSGIAGRLHRLAASGATVAQYQSFA
jgi:hypothetical protein